MLPFNLSESIVQSLTEYLGRCNRFILFAEIAGIVPQFEINIKEFINYVYFPV